MRRDLDWDGCCNVRDLGGLPLRNGGVTPFGRVVRSDNPQRLSAAGWAALEAYGIRTVLTLRTVGTSDEEPDPALVPPAVHIVRVELEDATDPEFRRRCIDTGYWMTPLEWAEMLRSWPQRCASAVAAVARADEGGVLVSCGIGRDRTGLASFLLQALVGVTADAMVQDWRHSTERLVGDPMAGDVSEILEREGRTVADAVGDALALGVEERLLDGGLSEADLVAARARLTA